MEGKDCVEDMFQRGWGGHEEPFPVFSRGDGEDTKNRPLCF